MSAAEEITALKKFVRATNYLAVSQIYLRDNVLLEHPLRSQDIKPRLLGHWGTCPGINFVYAHINRLICKHQTPFTYLVGPGHGFPAVQANLFLEQSLSHYYPEKIPYNAAGMREICANFSAPYGYPSHSNPAAPGAILEGGELGYALSVAFGAVMDNPELISVCLVGDGEAETGPLAAAWHANKVLSPAENGAVLPILHANGYKISGPTIFGRMSNEEVTQLFEGYGYAPHIVDYDQVEDIYVEMAATMDHCYAAIRDIQTRARSGEDVEKPRWPMIVLRTPKGWTGTRQADGVQFEGNCASHQVILSDAARNPQHLQLLNDWLASYRFRELFSEVEGQFRFDADIESLIPPQGLACGSQRLAYGGEVVKPLSMPDLEQLALPVTPGKQTYSSMKLTGSWLKALFARNRGEENLRIFSPDETYSNQIGAVFEETRRSWQWPLSPLDSDMARDGKVVEMLSEHTLFGMTHGYTVTGRHGVFVSYEAFVQVVSSMADQYCKFIRASQPVAFRKPVPALNVILTSLLERQDHNGFSHQNPSFLASALSKDEDIITAYLPPDANSLLVTMQRSFESRDAMNLIVAGKKDLPQWLTLEQARQQVRQGIMTWEFASDENPDVVLAACGDYVTQEALAAVDLLHELLPQVRVRFVCVSELNAEGIGPYERSTDPSYLDQYFTADKGVVFNFHGYPQTIRHMLFRYPGNQRIKVNGYQEHGSTTTPFDMEVRNGTSRYHLVLDLAEKAHQQGVIGKAEIGKTKAVIHELLENHKAHILAHGVDPQSIKEWRWKGR